MMIIEVRRFRLSVTQGMAEVWINGKKIVPFADTIEIIKEGQKSYGAKIGLWASTKPDSDFIHGLFYHPHDHVYKYSELANKAIIEADNPQDILPYFKDKETINHV